MATTLKRFSDAYATMTVAVYEPMMIKWVSTYSLTILVNTVALRAQKGKHLNAKVGLPTALRLDTGAFRPHLPSGRSAVPPGPKPPVPSVVDNDGNPISTKAITAVHLQGYPDAVMIGDKLYPFGAVDVRSAGAVSLGPSSASAAQPSGGDPFTGAKTIPTLLNRRMGYLDADFDFRKVRNVLLEKVLVAVGSASAGDMSLADVIRGSLAGSFQHPLFEFLPVTKIEEGLSPIGLALLPAALLPRRRGCRTARTGFHHRAEGNVGSRVRDVAPSDPRGVGGDRHRGGDRDCDRAEEPR